VSARRWLSRWPLASLLNRLPWTCWASLVPWALGWHRFTDVTEIREAFDVGTCRRDAQASGCCYCGKFQTAEFQRDHVPAHYKRGFRVEDA